MCNESTDIDFFLFFYIFHGVHLQYIFMLMLEKKIYLYKIVLDDHVATDKSNNKKKKTRKLVFDAFQISET